VIKITKVETIFTSAATHGAGLRVFLDCGHYYDFSFEEDYHAVMKDKDCPRCELESIILRMLGESR